MACGLFHTLHTGCGNFAACVDASKSNTLFVCIASLHMCCQFTDDRTGMTDVLVSQGIASAWLRLNVGHQVW